MRRAEARMTTRTRRIGAAACIAAIAAAGCGGDSVVPGNDASATTDVGVSDLGADRPTVTDVPVTGDVPATTDVADAGAAMDVAADVPGDLPASTIPTAATLFTRNDSFSTPLTVALTSSGATAYFTARTPGGVATLFRSTGGTSAPTVVPVTGVPLVFPTGLAIGADDAHLYIADQAASRGGAVFGTEEGALLSIATEGGAATAINIGMLRRPRAVAVHGSPEQLTFIAFQDDGTPVVARTAASGGGTATVIASGAGDSPLRDPSALAVAADGTVYLTDARADGGLGAVFRIAPAGTPVRILRHLRMGLPAGIALSADERHVLVAGWDVETGPGRLTWAATDGTGAMSPAAFGTPITSPAGVARAHGSDTYGIADDTATDTAATSWGGVFSVR